MSLFEKLTAAATDEGPVRARSMLDSLSKCPFSVHALICVAVALLLHRLGGGVLLALLWGVWRAARHLRLRPARPRRAPGDAPRSPSLLRRNESETGDRSAHRASRRRPRPGPLLPPSTALRAGTSAEPTTPSFSPPSPARGSSGRRALPEPLSRRTLVGEVSDGIWNSGTAGK